MMGLQLHSYWRATAPFRVRIGLNLKGLTYDYVPVDLLKGEQNEAAYKTVNPQGLTPALVTPDGEVLIQTLAILEWLDETHPAPPLLPPDPLGRAAARAMALIVACDIHPLNNARVIRELAARGQDEAARDDWARKWIAAGFDALEPMIARHGRGFAYGDAPTLADCCLAPQAYGAARFRLALDPWPNLAAVVARYADHPAFAAAHPDRQPDAP